MSDPGTIGSSIIDPALKEEWPHLYDIVELLTERKIVPGAEFYEMATELRGTAGTLAEVWNTRFIGDIYGSLADAIQKGATVKDWVRDAQAILDRYGSAEGLQVYTGDRFAPWYADVVFRQNVQSAYAAGRLSEQFSPAGLQRAGYLLFSAIRDNRNNSDEKCPGMICRRLDGLVVSKLDTSMRRFLAPRHFNCRCHEIELDDVDVEAGGYKVVTGASLTETGAVMPEGWDTDRVAQLVPGALKRI